MLVNDLVDTLQNVSEGHVCLKNACNYTISMKNAFVTRSGEINKYQVLSAGVRRRCRGYSSSDRLYLEAEYLDAAFYEGRRVQNPELRVLTFPAGEVVSHYKLVPNDDIQNFRERYDYVDAISERSVPFSKFPATPIVNLLQLQCYDVIALEELHSQVVKNQTRLRKLGSQVNIILDNAETIALQFKGAIAGQSSFDMFELDIEFAGLSAHMESPVLVYKYESRGTVRVSRKAGGVRELNVGESYFYGDIYIDASDGDLERATMCEVLTMSRIAGAADPLPIHRRRKVDYYRS